MQGRAVDMGEIGNTQFFKVEVEKETSVKIILEMVFEALKVLGSYEDKLYCIKKGVKYPLHPSRMHYDCSLVKCSVGNTVIA